MCLAGRLAGRKMGAKSGAKSENVTFVRDNEPKAGDVALGWAWSLSAGRRRESRWPPESLCPAWLGACPLGPDSRRVRRSCAGGKSSVGERTWIIEHDDDDAAAAR